MIKLNEYDLKNYRFSILFVIAILNFIGSYLMQFLQNEENKHFEKQMLGLAAGLIVTVIVSLIDYHFICKFFIPLYIINLVFLAMVKYSIFGAKHFDAQRWLRFPNGSVESKYMWFEIQPSELAKVILILVLAKIFELAHLSINKWYVIMITSILVLIPIYFIFDQPDLSTSMVVIIIYLIMLYMAGISYKLIIIACSIGIPTLIGLFWYIQQPFQKLLQPYQLKRIFALNNPELHADDLMWQQNNAAIAIRSGGMIGKIFTTGVDTLECKSVPAIESDFIFAAIAEGFGFIGCCVVLLLYAYLTFRFLVIAKNAKDRLGTYIATGAATMITMQFFFNVGVATSLLPNTGIPLPFISSGLSSLFSTLLLMGIVLNIDLQHKKAVEKNDKLIISNEVKYGKLSQ